MADAGAVFCWALSGVMKSKSPPPPFKKGGEKAPDFLTVNDETRPLEISNTLPPPDFLTVNDETCPLEIPNTLPPF
ncbi:MAG: hypothetical protein NTZ45_02600 [Methylococcales bacterium]|nr:hypothetical protein [Methylococcales bacterium]